MSTQLLKARDVAELLGVDIKTVRRHTRAGHYPFARNLGSPQRPTWRYDRRSLDRWLDTRQHHVA